MLALVIFLLLVLWMWYERPPTLADLPGIVTGVGVGVFLCVIIRLQVAQRARPEDAGLKLAAWLRWPVAMLIWVGVFATRPVLLRYQIDYQSFLAYTFFLSTSIAFTYAFINKY